MDQRTENRSFRRYTFINITLELSEAKNMIISAVSGHKPVQRWADLGCGSGLFTTALAELLPNGSTVYAIDRSFQTITPPGNAVTIDFIQHNFENTLPPDIENLDGMMMANSLHYISDKEKLIRKLIPLLKPDGQFMIIEYETKNVNPWVPYPVTFNELKQLFSDFGFQKIEKISERPSVYGNGMMYAASIGR
ncbi:methyltransferase type 11 [Elizabethkingia meningoseptica]|nr:methyltransferase type 11 [Elizabethkingia meningoseptica]AQX47443.1 methyltransferase type 11 [Elizabethkingia meningoseptica]KUY24291.1 methyltransferase type 11 [Elizabethkingia meningoseptica]OPB67510.1 methyltransferase type 11 [Elizabethkingia meningoseptica]